MGDKKNFSIMLLLTLSILILNGKISSTIILGFGVFCWGIIYTNSNRQNNHVFSALRMIILSIPLSFTDIFGQAYGVTVISWFNIFILFTILIYLFNYVLKGNAYFNKLTLLSILMLIVALVPTLLGNNIIDGLKQYINTTIIFLLVIVGNSFKYNLTDIQIDMLINDYISGTIITSLGTIIQILYISIFKINTGNYKFLGGYRHAYGFLFGDYSFLSLYIVSGAMMLYFKKQSYKGSRIKWIFTIGFLLITSMLTSARTGIVSFMAIFILYNLTDMLKLIKKGSIKSILIPFWSITITIIAYTLVGRLRNVAKFSDSGRGELNIIALKLFLERPYLGIGFGSKNYIGVLPHNLLLQSLAQGGLIYTVPLILFLSTALFLAYKRKSELFPVILCVLFGSMFIPNVFNSRFLPVLLLLLSLSI